ncbi:unnamed protein product [Linum trigynum]|uniref:Uncharacterized protein n=1 Tax=Linum trigynum TaxID=586398 RepID=A0AAV2GWF5_9ROSI
MCHSMGNLVGSPWNLPKIYKMRQRPKNKHTISKERATNGILHCSKAKLANYYYCIANNDDTRQTSR